MRRTWLAAMIGTAALLSACGGGSEEPAPSEGATADESTTAAATETAPGTNDADSPAPQASSTTPAADPSVAPPKMAAAIAMPDSFKQCQACHSAEPGKNGIGPSLAGVYGTRAGLVPGFDFSDAMKNSGLTWDTATLDRYLTKPMDVVPGTKMAFAGIKDADKRKAVIAYLKAIR